MLCSAGQWLDNWEPRALSPNERAYRESKGGRSLSSSMNWPACNNAMILCANG